MTFKYDWVSCQWGTTSSYSGSWGSVDCTVKQSSSGSTTSYNNESCYQFSSHSGSGHLDIDYGTPVQNVSFNLYGVSLSQCGSGKTCDVTFYDKDGNVVPTQYTWNGSCVVVTASKPVCSIDIDQNSYDCDFKVGSINCDPLPGDGIVEGTGGNDLIDYDYLGDPDGDKIDHNDALRPGEYGNDDIVVAGDGNDTVLAGAGNDEVYGGAGDDSLSGGAGNDVLIGDAESATYGSPEAVTTVRESFEWDKAPDPNACSANDLIDNDDRITNFVQDTGEAKVTFTISNSSGSPTTTYSDKTQLVTGIDSGTETIDSTSALDSYLNSKGEWVEYKLQFDVGVSNVEFRINDMDYDSTVRVFAYDASGQKVPVVLTAGSGITLYDTDGVNGTDAGVSKGGDGSNTSNTYSMLVEIAGPITKLEILHYQDGYDASGITVTDIFYDVTTVDPNAGVPGADSISGGDGDDHIDGNQGNDVLAGDAGNDRIIGGDGDDTMYGGAGNDTIDDVIGTINDGQGNDVAYGGDGDDKIFTGYGNDTLYGGAGNDTVSGEAGNDYVSGDAGNDRLIGGDGDDSLLGGDGDDVIDDVEGTDNDGQGNDYADGGSGNDRIYTGLGNDTLLGGEGNDLLSGEAGNDTLTGGDGNDEMYGGNDRDVIFGGAGDEVYGGSGGDDYDILDLTGKGPFYLDNVTPDANGNGYNGTVVFVDANGVATGETLTYEEIEEVRGDNVGHRPDAANDSTSTNYGQAVTVPVLLNDTDLDGDTLTIVSASSPDGAVTVNPDGTLTFVPNQGFSGPATIVYTITDGTSTDSATATVNVAAPLLDGTVEGTAGNDVIDGSYLGDPDGDRVDSNDAILPGDTGNDDLIYGFGGNDSILAGDGNDEAYGGTGNDTIDGGAGDDTLSGDDGNDTLTGGDGNDIVYGGNGDDSLHGNAGVDTLYVGSGNDVAAGGAGNDVVYGDDGNDTLTGGDGDDAVYGGNNNDSIGGNAGDDSLYGGAGDDTLDGGAGNDLVDGGIGNDSILAGDGRDSVLGGDGDDVIDTSAPLTSGGSPDLAFPGLWTADLDPDNDKDTVDGGAGNDRILTGDDDDSIIGGAGSDYIDGGWDKDTIDAGTGNDTVIGGEGDDSILGGDGNDLIYGGMDDTYPDAINVPNADGDPVLSNGKDVIDAGAGDDTVYGKDDDDIIYGGTGNDYLDGGVDDDSVYGGAGNDRLIGGQGNDLLSGGDGNDSLSGDDGNDSLTGGAGNDSLSGGDGQDAIDAGTGNDTVDGGAGDDSIIGGTGNDSIIGGDGDDTIDSSGGALAGRPDLAYPGLWTADSDPYNDRDTVFGGAGNDRIITGDDDDTIYGGTGNDYIDGGWDKDSIDAGDGDDTIIGGEGDDTINAGAGDDLIYGGLDDSYPDTINVPDDNGDLVVNNGRDTIDAGDGDDTVYGRDDDDTIFGGSGNDLLDGEIDDDVIYGGTGNDTVLGGQGNDTLFGDIGNDILSGGDGNDTLYAGDGQDQITGGAGVDTQFGGFGSDTFFGGNGNDVVYGGEDTDNGDWDVLDLTGSNVTNITYTSTDHEDGIVTFQDGSTMTFSDIENVIPCFTPGTLIATPKGEKLVQDLCVGDKVITRDNGIQEIAWVGHKQITGRQLIGSPHLRPVLIKAGSLGRGLPERDMMVSPNHRMLIASDLTQLYFEEREVLAAAKHLVGSAGIHQVDAMSVTYVHFMFERHEVVLSDGAWTESFQPGDYSLKGIGASQRDEIMELFPELKEKHGLENYQAARRSLKKHEAKLLVQ